MVDLSGYLQPTGFITRAGWNGLLQTIQSNLGSTALTPYFRTSGYITRAHWNATIGAIQSLIGVNLSALQTTGRVTRVKWNNLVTIIQTALNSVVVVPTLNALSLSSSLYTVGTPAGGAISGSTPGSSIAASSTPNGFTINSSARTWTYDGAGFAGSGSLTLSETLAGATPRSTSISYTVNASGTGTALPAAILSRTSATATTYPFTTSNTRPIEWRDGDTAVMQVSADPTFATGVSEVPNVQYAATTSYSWGLASIVTPQARYARLAAWTGTRPGVLNWSNIQGVGDAIAPTITSTAAPTGYQFISNTLTVTADKPGYLSVVGGADMAQFTQAGATLTYLAQAAAGTLVVQVQWTSYFSVSSPIQTINLTLANNTPAQITWTPITNAAFSTGYSPATLGVVSGIIGGVSVPLSITGGTYQKNSTGGFVLTSGSVVNGDTIFPYGVSGAANNLTTSVAVTTGSTVSAFDISTPIVASQWDPATVSAPGCITFSNGNRTATMTAAAGPVNFKGTTTNNSGKKWIEFTAYYDPSTSITVGLLDTTTGVAVKWANDGTTGTGTTWGGVGYFNNSTVVKLMMVCDFTAQTVAGYKNGVFQGTITMPTNFTNPRPWAEPAYGIGPYATINTGQATPMGGVVSGSVAWG